MKFTLNGEDKGIAWSMRMEEHLSFVPHVFIKNCSVELNFGQQKRTFSKIPEGFNLLNEEGIECEEIKTASAMINLLTAFVGLPGAGKTKWMEKMLPEIIEGRPKPLITGTRYVADQMKISGAGTSHSIEEIAKFKKEKAAEALQVILKKAIAAGRDVIVDDCNTLPVQRRTLFAPFQKAGYYCQAMIVVPKEEVRVERMKEKVAACELEIPEDDLKRMKAEIFVPEGNDGVFNKVKFLELAQEEATKLVEEYNKEFKSFLKKPEPVVDLTNRVTPPVDRKRSRSRSPRKRRSRSKSRDRSRDRSRRDRTRDRSRERRRRRSRSPRDDRDRRRRSSPRRDDRDRRRDRSYDQNSRGNRDSRGAGPPRADGPPQILRGARIPRGLKFVVQVQERAMAMLDAYVRANPSKPIAAPKRSMERLSLNSESGNHGRRNENSSDQAWDPRRDDRSSRPSHDEPRSEYARQSMNNDRSNHNRGNYREESSHVSSHSSSQNDPRRSNGAYQQSHTSRDGPPQSSSYQKPTPMQSSSSDDRHTFDRAEDSYRNRNDPRNSQRGNPDPRNSNNSMADPRNDFRNNSRPSNDPRNAPRNDPLNTPRNDPRDNPRNAPRSDPRNAPRNGAEDPRRSDPRADPRRSQGSSYGSDAAPVPPPSSTHRSGYDKYDPSEPTQNNSSSFNSNSNSYNSNKNAYNSSSQRSNQSFGTSQESQSSQDSNPYASSERISNPYASNERSSNPYSSNERNSNPYSDNPYNRTPTDNRRNNSQSQESEPSAPRATYSSNPYDRPPPPRFQEDPRKSAQKRANEETEYIPSTVDKFMKLNKTKDEVFADLKAKLFENPSVQSSSGVPPPKQRRAQSPPRSRSPPQSSSKYDHGQSPHGRLFASSQPSHNDSYDDIISTLPRAAQERAKNMPAHLPPELVVQEATKQPERAPQGYHDRGPPMHDYGRGGFNGGPRGGFDNGFRGRGGGGYRGRGGPFRGNGGFRGGFDNGFRGARGGGFRGGGRPPFRGGAN